MWMRTLGAAFTFAICVLVAGPGYGGGNVVGHLSGDEEVTPVDTRAQGQAIFKLRGNHSDLSYKLITANIQNIVAAHIHCGAEGVNGPVGVTLHTGAPMAVNGILAQGPILMPNAGNACGWLDNADVIDALHSGNTYVNVHTLQNLAGEIRGQLR